MEEEGPRYWLWSAGGLLVGPLLIPETGIFAGEPGCDVFIRGNGAVLDLRGGQICISYCDNRLDIEDCVIVGGNVRYGVRPVSTAARDGEHRADGA